MVEHLVSCLRPPPPRLPRTYLSVPVRVYRGITLPKPRFLRLGVPTGFGHRVPGRSLTISP